MLMPDEVKKLIPHPDSEVRSRAVEYFAGTPEDDGTILPLVLETAADLHLPVRKWPHDWYKLILRTEVVPQLLQFAPDFALKDGRSKNQLLYLPRMLARLPLADWESVRPALDQAGILNEPLIKRFERRREFALLDEEALYDRVHDYAEAHNDDDSQKFDMTYFDDLAQALGHFENLDETILLNEMTLAGGGASWAELPFIDAVAFRRMKSALPYLVDLLGEEGDYTSEHVIAALSRMGDPTCVPNILSRCNSGFLYPLRSGHTLGSIHSPEVEQHIIEYLNTTKAKDSPYLLIALSKLFSAAAIPMILRELAKGRADHFLLGDLEMDVRTLSIALNEPLPGDLRRIFELNHLEFQAKLDDYDFTDSSAPLLEDQPLDEEELLDDVQQAPATPPAPSAQCPCGSGKKFKKCCMYK